jgi:hypothetical protein
VKDVRRALGFSLKEVSGASKIELFFDPLAADITASGLKMKRVARHACMEPISTASMGPSFDSKKGGVEKFNRFAYILPRQLVQDEPSRTPTAYCFDSCLGVSWLFALWPFVGRDWNVAAGSPVFFLPQLTPKAQYSSYNRI